MKDLTDHVKKESKEASSLPKGERPDTTQVDLPPYARKTPELEEAFRKLFSLGKEEKELFKNRARMYFKD